MAAQRKTMQWSSEILDCSTPGPQAECNLESEMMISETKFCFCSPWLHLYMLGYVGCVFGPRRSFCLALPGKTMWKQRSQQVNQRCEHRKPPWDLLHTWNRNRPCLVIKTSSPSCDGLVLHSLNLKLLLDSKWPNAISRCGKALRQRSSSIHRRSQNSSGTSHGSAWDLSRRIWAGRSVHPLHICKISKEFLRVRNL